jgi:RNA polymerase sigma-70 factor (ECF subfamily)
MYHARVFGVVFRMVPQADDAQDLTQLTWVKAWQRLGTYKQEARFFTWLYRIATNTAMDFIRSRARKREVELTEQAIQQQDDLRPGPTRDPARPDREMEQDEIHRAFREALDKLSHEHKSALILREVEGMSYREIAETMKCRVGTVMSRIYYARRAIQQSMRGVR